MNTPKLTKYELIVATVAVILLILVVRTVTQDVLHPNLQDEYKPNPKEAVKGIYYAMKDSVVGDDSKPKTDVAQQLKEHILHETNIDNDNLPPEKKGHYYKINDDGNKKESNFIENVKKDVGETMKKLKETVKDIARDHAREDIAEEDMII